MACSADFVQFIVDQCSGAGEISVRKMMGDYCIYCNGTIFGLICDNNLYIKETDAGRAVLKEEVLRKPYEGARDYFYIADVDDSDYLEEIIRVTMPALRKPEPKRNSRVVKTKQSAASLDDIIPPGIVCSQELRAFFEQHLGKDFKYKVPFQNWLHNNAGKTYRDAVEAYKEMVRRPDIWPFFE
jgi:TfoX/Sxy family transcriptional regulator of competence genes